MEDLEEDNLTYKNILFSKTRVGKYDTPTERAFNQCVSDLLEHGDVQSLSDFHQHLRTSRLTHCVNVAYYSFLISRFLKLNAYSAARAGLLHDLFLYDWRTEKKDEAHAFAHPKEALKAARNITYIDHIEENAILAHMWPLAKSRPRYGVSVAVCLADKFCCISEVCVSLASSLKTELFRRRYFFKPAAQ